MDAGRYWLNAVRYGRALIGVPDYETYVRHLRAAHPERPVPTYSEFFNERMHARYRPGAGRCC
jgi:uncharacterized short protein YbdD (DUF466 family)